MTEYNVKLNDLTFVHSLFLLKIDQIFENKTYPFKIILFVSV